MSISKIVSVSILFTLTLLVVAGCRSSYAEEPAAEPQPAAAEAEADAPPASFPEVGTRVEMSEEAWRERLTSEEFYVLREQGTERAFTGDLLDHKGQGVYVCAACGAPLFHSEHKFTSGTGWPSYYQPIEEGRVGEHQDTSYGMVRVEVVCERCGGHLGHVFTDGPEPTGLRYCINSVSLDFVSEEAASEE